MRAERQIKGCIMNLHISDEARGKTTKCPYDFICLNDAKKLVCGENTLMCAPDKVINEQYLFIKSAGTNDCPYKMSFGFSHICHCPVRLEIFERYSI